MKPMKLWLIGGLLAVMSAAGCSYDDDDDDGMDATPGMDRTVTNPDATAGRDAAADGSMEMGDTGQDGGVTMDPDGGDDGGSSTDAMPGDATPGDTGPMGSTFTGFVRDQILNRTNETATPVAIPNGLTDTEDQTEYQDLF